MVCLPDTPVEAVAPLFAPVFVVFGPAVAPLFEPVFPLLLLVALLFAPVFPLLLLVLPL